MNYIEIIDELVTTRINGNRIDGNKTYSKMLKRVTKQQIVTYNNTMVGHIDILFGSKLEMIEQIRNSIVYR